MRQTVKKALCAVFILFFSISTLYAANKKNIMLNIQGTGRADLVEGFIGALKIEASAAGYDVSDNPTASKYYIKFTIEFDNVEQKSRFNVSLVRTAGSEEIVAMEYLFTDEEEMLLYSQLVFFMLMANLPEDEIAPTTIVVGQADDSWRDKWLYIRASFDYSLLYLKLKPDGLIGGAGVYDGPFASPTAIAPLDNKIVPMPGVRLGVEVQLFDFLSLEPGVQVSYEEMIKNNLVINMLFTMQIKFPLKFLSGLVIEPYLEAGYPMRFGLASGQKEVYAKDFMPKLVYGLGLQTAAKMGKSGALIFDFSYLFYLEGVGLNNYFKKAPPSPSYPNPSVIKYDYSVIGFGIGYKHGIFNRKKK
jgi:hypothetical protein